MYIQQENVWTSHLLYFRLITHGTNRHKKSETTEIITTKETDKENLTGQPSQIVPIPFSFLSAPTEQKQFQNSTSKDGLAAVGWKGIGPVAFPLTAYCVRRVTSLPSFGGFWRSDRYHGIPWLFFTASSLSIVSCFCFLT
ncbi:hypothetical protein B0H65DRAFT_450614 [Neurospora tetraspora]|uniref:Uncharacterized protein n=1 Tax=Neurospora tetraspora TaxID=94610 RepID=A0AAE0JP23_9PEZI|nr:hypothetical protein B0H65DRAFT_450614 [Neurospora tetraspora]